MNGLSTRCKIHCCKCGNDFYIYRNTMLLEQLQCPHCLTKMDETMSHSVQSAINTVDEINRDFIKYHDDRNDPQFVISVDSVSL